MGRIWVAIAILATGLPGVQAAPGQLPFNVTLNATYPGLVLDDSRWRCTNDALYTNFSTPVCTTNSPGNSFALTYWGTSLRVSGNATLGTKFVMTANGRNQFGTSTIEDEYLSDSLISYRAVGSQGPSLQQFKFVIESGAIMVGSFNYETQIETQAPDLDSIAKQKAVVGDVDFFNATGRWDERQMLEGGDGTPALSYPTRVGYPNATLEFNVPPQTSFMYLYGSTGETPQTFRLEITPKPDRYTMPDVARVPATGSGSVATLLAQVLDPSVQYHLVLRAGSGLDTDNAEESQLYFHGAEFFSSQWSGSSSKSNAGAIAGGVVGGVVGIVLISVLVWWFCFRRKKMKVTNGPLEVDSNDPQYLATPYPTTAEQRQNMEQISEKSATQGSSASGLRPETSHGGSADSTGPLLSPTSPATTRAPWSPVTDSSSQSAGYMEHKNAALAQLDSGSPVRNAPADPHERDAGRVMRAGEVPEPLPPMYDPAWNDSEDQAEPGIYDNVTPRRDPRTG